MKTKSPQRTKSVNKEIKIFERFNIKTINKIAKDSGFRKRKSGKISARNLIIGFMIMVSKKKNTYDSWSQEVSIESRKTISKQAIEERMRPETTIMTKKILEEELKKSIKQQTMSKAKRQAISMFEDIKAEDSTTLNLPEELATTFPGNVSKGKKKALSKVHALYSFKENSFDFLDLHNFSNNDQSLASHALRYLHKGDLLLRDMGFLVMDVLAQIATKGVYFISRKKSNINVYDVDSEKEINLNKLLRKKGFIDSEVLISKKKIKMRLVIIPVSPEQAAQKRRKARKDRDKRLNHNKEYYDLLGYSIFITNIHSSQCSSEAIKDLYSLRWQIEIIFKSWKSCFSIEKLIPAKCKNPNRIYCTIYLLLLFILLFHVVWMNNSKSKTRQNLNLSLIKMANFFLANFYSIFYCLDERFLSKLIPVKCRYEKRCDRLNLLQKYEKYAA